MATDTNRESRSDPVWMSHWIERPRRVWTDIPACRGHDPNLFYPAGGAPVEAIAICQQCPVRVECLQYALDNDEQHGVQGGVPEGDRFRWRKRNMPAGAMIVHTDLRYPVTPGSDQPSSSAA